jgi:hypothetical protein
MAKAKIAEIRLEPLDGKSGVMSHVTHEAKRSGQGGGPLYDHDVEKRHHGSLDDLQRHVAKHLAGNFKGTDEQEEKDEENEQY